MKQKILFVNGHLNVGGVEKSLIDILRNIDYQKYDVDLILFEDLGDYYPLLPKEVNLRFIDITKTFGPASQCLISALKHKDFFTLFMKIILILSSKFSQRFLILAKPLLKINKNYDCAIAFRVGFCAEIVAHCIKSKKKIVWWHHGECNFDSRTKQRMVKTFNDFNTIVSVSKGCKTMIQNYFNLDTSKLIVIPNMIDILQIQNNAVHFDPYRQNDTAYKIVTVGRLSSEKNIGNVIAISKELIQSGFDNFIWYVIGDGIEYSKIKNLIIKNELTDYIKMEGRQSNPYPYIYYADVIVHTSLVESQCLTVLEGLALSKPCIVSESIGPKEFIVNNENGILTSHDPKQIANEIISLFNDENRFNKIKGSALKVVQDKYSASTIIKLVERLIEQEVKH